MNSRALLKHVKIRFVTILRNINIQKYSHVYSLIVVILFLTLKLVKQHATKSHAAITQEKFCNILPRLTTVCYKQVTEIRNFQKLCARSGLNLIMR